MTEGEHDKLHEMSGRLGGVEASVRYLTETWRHQDEEAANSRSRLYDKFEQMIRVMEGLGNRVDNLTNKVATLEPSVLNLTYRDQRAIGSKKALGLIWAALIGVIGATAGAAVEIVHLLWPKH